MQRILTANRLRDGQAVWLAADHSWVGRIEDAAIARDEAMAERLERAARAALLKKEVADVDVIEIMTDHVSPLRRRVRAKEALYGNRAKAA